MTVRFRSDNGEWRIVSDVSLQFGTTVTATRRNGSTSDVVVGGFVRMLPPEDMLRFMYRFTDARRAAGAVPEDVVSIIPNVERLFLLFNNARNHSHQAPAIRFALSTTMRGLRLEMAGQSSRYAGHMLALSEQRSGARRTMYGHLSPHGEYRSRVGATQIEQEIHTEILNVLTGFAADPAGFSAAHGRQTGQCCYCGRGLTGPRSVAVGYGPICADHFGLPWGDAPAFDVHQGSQRQQERLADNAGRENAFDLAVANLNANLEAANLPPVSTDQYMLIVPAESLMPGVPTIEDIQNEPDPMRRMAMAAQRHSAGLPPIARRNTRGELITPPAPPASAAPGVVTNTYRRQRTTISEAVLELERRAARARRPAVTPPPVVDETRSEFIAAERRPANSPLEEDDFKWPPQERA